MKKVLVVMGSARVGRSVEKIASLVRDELVGLGVEPVVVDLKALNLPFFDDAATPSSENFVPSNDAAKEWTASVDSADGVILLTPEYNHGTSAILKNAIDWVYTPWQGKPVSIIGYGWGGASFAVANLKESMSHLKSTVLPTTGSLYFMKNVGVDGSPADDETAKAVSATLAELVTTLG